MTDQEIANFNSQVRSQAAMRELRQVRALQKQAAAEGMPLSRKQARELLQRQDDQASARTNEINAAVNKAVPQFERAGPGPGGVLFPPPVPPDPQPVSDNAIVIPRFDETDTAQNVSTLIIWINGNPFKQGVYVKGSPTSYP